MRSGWQRPVVSLVAGGYSKVNGAAASQRLCVGDMFDQALRARSAHSYHIGRRMRVARVVASQAWLLLRSASRVGGTAAAPRDSKTLLP